MSVPGSLVLEMWRLDKAVIQCDVCKGLGWKQQAALNPTTESGVDRWPVSCYLCSGYGRLSLHAIAKLIGEDPGVVYRLYEQRIRPKTAQRILPKLTALYSGALIRPGGLIDAAR